MKAPIAGILFRIYIAAEDDVIGAELAQVTDGKERIITYLSQRLIDVEARHSFIEKLCYSCFILVPTYDITCYLVLVYLRVRLM
jgi:hypothetical protein